MIALLLAAAALAPVDVTTTNPECGVISINVTAPAGTQMNGLYDIGGQPPWQHADSKNPVRITLHRAPGTVITWGVAFYEDNATAASGEVVVPPCISAPLPPRPHIVVDDTVDIGTPLVIVRSHRGDVFAHWTQRVRGAW